MGGAKQYLSPAVFGDTPTGQDNQGEEKIIIYHFFYSVRDGYFKN